MIGVVLAGGASTRMGRDKATLTLGGEPLAARAARRLAAVSAEVAVADAGRGLLPGHRSLADGPGRGPAAGLLGAALAFPGRPLLVLACDLPLVPEALLGELGELARSSGCDWAVPRWEGRVEPLCALYGPAALERLAARVARGELALHRLAEDTSDTEEPGLAVSYLEGPDLARFGRPGEMFLNLNRPEDLARLL